MAKVSRLFQKSDMIVDLKIADGSAFAEGVVYYISGDDTVTVCSTAHTGAVKGLCLGTKTDTELDAMPGRVCSFLIKGAFTSDVYASGAAPAVDAALYYDSAGKPTNATTLTDKIGRVLAAPQNGIFKAIFDGTQS